MVYYWVSGSVTREQAKSVAYGMYRDFEFGYESLQASRLDFYSAFAPEDLPSDHIGFWAYVNGKDYNEIPGILQSLGTTRPWYGGSLLTDILVTLPSGRFPRIEICFPRNYDFLPMAPEVISGERVHGRRWLNKPWPEWLQIKPIPSGPDTWQRVD